LYVSYYRKGLLTTHKGASEDEIWIKIGGDKGGTSFKMNVQICNVRAPNSVQNTCVFAAFEAGDSPTNLHIALKRYQTQIQSLQEAKWR